MGIADKGVDITRNIKMIEWLKSELLTDVAGLFKQMAGGDADDGLDEVGETLSNLILVSYLLSKRLGISYQMIDMKIESKLKLGILEGHDLEKNFADLSELAKHLNSVRNRPDKSSPTYRNGK